MRTLSGSSRLPATKTRRRRVAAIKQQDDRYYILSDQLKDEHEDGEAISRPTSSPSSISQKVSLPVRGSPSSAETCCSPQPARFRRLPCWLSSIKIGWSFTASCRRPTIGAGFHCARMRLATIHAKVQERRRESRLCRRGAFAARSRDWRQAEHNHIPRRPRS